MTSVLVLALLLVALLLSAIELVEAHGRSLIAWAVLIIAVVLVMSALGVAK